MFDLCNTQLTRLRTDLPYPRSWLEAPGGRPTTERWATCASLKDRHCLACPHRPSCQTTEHCTVAHVPLHVGLSLRALVLVSVQHATATLIADASQHKRVPWSSRAHTKGVKHDYNH